MKRYAGLSKVTRTKIRVLLSCIVFTSVSFAAGNPFAAPAISGSGGGSSSTAGALGTGDSSAGSSASGGVTVPSIVINSNDADLSAGSNLNLMEPKTHNTLGETGSDNDKLLYSKGGYGQAGGGAPSTGAVTAANLFDAFQRNILIRSGLNLPRYGSNLFRNPQTFAPIQNLPVPSGYVLGPGDAVQIRTWGAVTANLDTQVGPDGNIYVPKVGKFNLTGVKAEELDSYLKQKLGQSFRNFSISADVGHVRTIQVTVAGYAMQAGTYQLSSLSTLTNAIFAVGGPSVVGSLRQVELRRHGRTIKSSLAPACQR